jgi:RNA-binding protein Luc7-like 2
MCPHDLFTGTKEDIGACSLVHDERLRKAYTEASKSNDFGYERELEHALERLLLHAEKTISKSRERVTDEGGLTGFIPPVDVEGDPELADISFEIEGKLADIREAQERGEFERAGKLEEELEVLRRRKSEMQASVLLSRATEEDRRASATNKQRLRVCNLCGAFVSLTDSRERIADHFGGRAHLGYVAIRQKLKNIREWRRASRGLGPNEAPAALAAWALQYPPDSAVGAAAAAAAAAAPLPSVTAASTAPSSAAAPPREGGGYGGGYGASSSSSSYAPRDGGGAGGYSRGGGGGDYRDRDGGGGGFRGAGGAGGGYRDRDDFRRSDRGYGTGGSSSYGGGSSGGYGGSSGGGGGYRDRDREEYRGDRGERGETRGDARGGERDRGDRERDDYRRRSRSRERDGGGDRYRSDRDRDYRGGDYRR